MKDKDKEKKSSKGVLFSKIKLKNLKKQQATVIVDDSEVASVLTDRRRFFKDEIEEDRRQLFFS